MNEKEGGYRGAREPANECPVKGVADGGRECTKREGGRYKDIYAERRRTRRGCKRKAATGALTNSSRDRRWKRRERSNRATYADHDVRQGGHTALIYTNRHDASRTGLPFEG